MPTNYFYLATKRKGGGGGERHLAWTDNEIVRNQSGATDSLCVLYPTCGVGAVTLDKWGVSSLSNTKNTREVSV